jgi:tRNA G46 methylase TrmB
LPQELLKSPYFLEIGSGTGRHAIQFALDNPALRIVAIERTRTKSAKARNLLEKLVAQGANEHTTPQNLVLIRDDAIHWGAHHIEPSSLSGVFILYPNPYPKASQRNKRFHFMPFMEVLGEGMQDGADLVLATNEPSYFLEALFILPRFFGLDVVSKRICDPRLNPRTNFEAHFFGLGLLCYEVTFRRRTREL